MDRLRFGTAGIPHKSVERTAVGGIKTINSLGLDAMELEFVHGVRMSMHRAYEVRKVSKSLDVTITAHAPYYINLNSSEKEKVEASIKRIYDTAKVTWAAGGYSIVFHAAYYGKVSKEKVYERVKENISKIVHNLKEEGIKIWVRPETMGKLSQFGTLEEIVKLSEEIDMVMPCVDFAHLHARSAGGFNTYDEFSSILEYIEKHLGREALDNMHIHFSGIEYGEKGERRHLHLRDSDMNYEAMLRAWKDYNIKGVAISESPNLEDDALLAKKIYQSL